MKKTVLLLVLVVSLSPNLVFAKEGMRKNNVDLMISAYRPTIDTSIRLDSKEFNVGTNLSLENDLGLADEETLP